MTSIRPAGTHADRVRNHILEDIQTGKLRPGEPFPPERKLAELLGVSRHILRQAMSSLESIGLVTVRPGSGIYVTEGVSDDAVMRVAEALIDREGSIYKILQVRQALEPGMARLAAQNRSEDNLTRLATLARYHANEAALDLGVESTSFHREIAIATGNSVFDGVMRTLITGPRRAEGLIKVVPAARSQWESEHIDILTAIRNQDGDLAESLMASHMSGILCTVEELDRVGGLNQVKDSRPNPSDSGPYTQRSTHHDSLHRR